MNTEDQIYVRLRQHLDRQAVGFPPSRDGSDLKVLRHIFTPEEAKLAVHLRDRFEPLEVLYTRARHQVASPEELARILDRILCKGGIEARENNGSRSYRNAPLVVGMYELQVGRLTPEFIRDFEAYTSGLRFGIEFLGTALPQMRTIPVTQSIRPHHRARTFDEVAALVDEAAGPFVILECICRKKKRLAGEACQVTARRETCLYGNRQHRPDRPDERQRPQYRASRGHGDPPGQPAGGARAAALQYRKSGLYLFMLRVLLRHASTAPPAA
jgi:electron transport complex protein RnfB